MATLQITSFKATSKHHKSCVAANRWKLQLQLHKMHCRAHGNSCMRSYKRCSCGNNKQKIKKNHFVCESQFVLLFCSNVLKIWFEILTLFFGKFTLLHTKHEVRLWNLYYHKIHYATCKKSRITVCREVNWAPNVRNRNTRGLTTCCSVFASVTVHSLTV